MDRILDELGLSRRGLVSAESAIRVGRLLKADLLLSGTVFSPKEGKSYILLECDELARAEPVGQVTVELGRVLEKGTHRELLEAGGTYAQMWMLQQQEPEGAGSP